jgi:hypothetical protein
MVSGFLGTVIGLERAVALGRRWTYAAPALSGLGALALLAGLFAPVPALLMTLSSMALTAASLTVVRLQPAMFTWTMSLGAATWLVGNVLWLVGRPLFDVALWWIGFPTLTIAGERLQLSRLLPTSGRRVSFLIATSFFLAGAVTAATGLAAISGQLAWRLAGAGMLGLAIWLIRFDIARRTVREPGLRRFIAVCMLSGYGWLGIAGLLALVWGTLTPGPRYDALLHAVFLGFVFAMIFGHAPIIVPAISGRSVPFRRSFYGHLLLLHVSLVIRLAGDLAGWPEGRSWGGLLNAIAIVLFALSTARAVIVGDRRVTDRGDRESPCLD